MSVIDLKDVTKVFGFGEAATIALDKATLEVEKGEFVAIMGPSGSGKSTLMNVIGMLDRPSSGIYKLDGKNVSKLNSKERALTRRKKIGFVFQSFNLLSRLSAIENVALPLTYLGMGHVERMKRSEEVLKNVKLEDRQYYMPNQLSGGQVQRVAVARALVNKPSIVLADEPTGNLDSKSGKDVMKLLSEIHKGGNTILVVTHDKDVASFADRTVHMKDGIISHDTKIHGRKKPAKKKAKKKTKKKSKKKDSKK